MRYGSVCSGIEAASVAWRHPSSEIASQFSLRSGDTLGWECAFVAETDPFASEVLKHRLPGVPNLGDFTKIRVTGNGERATGKEVVDYGAPSKAR